MTAGERTPPPSGPLPGLETPFLDHEPPAVQQRAESSPARLGELEAEAAFSSAFDLPSVQPGPGERERADEPGGELASPGAFELEEAGIIDGDNRVRVKDTTGVPWRWICKIDVADSRGRPAGAGTGLLISNRHVLTAAHVVHDAYKNMQQYTITVIPALDGLDEPFGRYALASKPRVRQEYDPTAADSLDWDYALLTLASAVGEQRFKTLNDRPLCFWGSPQCGESTMLARLDPGGLNGKAAYTAGYPGGKGGRQLWCAAGILHSANQQRRIMYTTADTTRGHSGSPVWVIDNKRHCLVGIAAGAGTGSNRIVRVTGELVRQLRAWITEGGETPAMVETEEALEPPLLLLPQPEAPPLDEQPVEQQFDPTAASRLVDGVVEPEHELPPASAEDTAAGQLAGPSYEEPELLEELPLADPELEELDFEEPELGPDSVAEAELEEDIEAGPVAYEDVEDQLAGPSYEEPELLEEPPLADPELEEDIEAGPVAYEDVEDQESEDTSASRNRFPLVSSAIRALLDPNARFDWVSKAVRALGSSSSTDVAGVLAGLKSLGPVEMCRLSEDPALIGALAGHLSGTKLDEVRAQLTRGRVNSMGRAELGRIIGAPRTHTLGTLAGAYGHDMFLEHYETWARTGTGTIHGNHSGVPTPAGAVSTDCTEYVLAVLDRAFGAKELAAEWRAVHRAAAKNSGPGGLKGTEVIKALQADRGWQAVFWAPDPRNPADGNSEHPFAYGKVRTMNMYYGINVDPARSVVNYRRTNPSHPVDLTDIERLQRLQFGLLAVRGGIHMAMIVNGEVHEVHWTTPATSRDAITATPLETFASQSGVIAAPPGDLDLAWRTP